MKSNAVWALIAGVAIGFIVGRELPRRGSAPAEQPTSAATAKKGAPPGVIPATWLTEDVFPKAKEQFTGLSAPQRAAVLKVINERKCDCGCPHTVAQCLKDDPNCARAGAQLVDAIALAKQGKSGDEILALPVKKGDAAPPRPSDNQKVALAKWTPVQGPRNAKVTMVVFSDFQ